MKRKTNVALFNILLFLSLMIFPLSGAGAQIFGGKGSGENGETSGRFHFSVAPAFSYASGHLGEYLYYSKFDDDSKKASYLSWDKKLFLYGAEIQASCSRIHFDASFLTSVRIPGFSPKSGIMSDSDWKNTSDYSMKTTYSVGDNKAVENYSVVSGVYYDFDVLENLSLSPMISFQYDYDSFSREDAEGWYSDGKHWWHDESSVHYPRVNPETGKKQYLAPIDYYRHSIYTWAGIKARYKICRKADFSFDFLASPFSYFYSIDTHWAKNSEKQWYGKHYRQIQTAYFPSLPALKMNARLSFALSRFFDLNIFASGLLCLKVSRGTWFSDCFQDSKQDDFYDSGQDSGATMQYFSLGIGIKVKVI